MSHLLEPPITLKGDLSKADVLTADEMLTTKRRKVVRLSTLAAVLALVLGVGASLREYDEDVSNWIFFGAMIVFPGLLLAPILLTRHRIHQAWATKTGIFDVAETTISNDGINQRLPHAVSQAEWAMFYAAMVRPTAVILFYHSSWMLFARSRFADEQEWNRFSTFVQQRFEIIHEL